MLGILVLSDRNIYKISTKDKKKTARKCIIISEKHDDVLITSNKEFSLKNEYVQIDPINKIVVQTLGIVGNKNDDLNIYHYLYTLNWMSNSKYQKLWNSYLNYSDDNIDNAVTRKDFYNDVFTIDPENSIDLDDGFSFDDDDNYYYLQIHIADPISYFDMNNLDFHKIIKELLIRINTCYIINSNGSNEPVHLLPPKLVSKVSLLKITDENQYRRSLTFDFRINKFTDKIDFELFNTKLYNIKNTTYEEYDNYINKNLKKKINLVELVNKFIDNIKIKHSKISLEEDISHKIIEIFMIVVNYYGGIYLKNNSKKSVIRVQDSNNLLDNTDLELVPDYVKPFLNSGACYKFCNQTCSDEKIDNYHFSLGIQNYTHLSSPMRRTIDIINHMLIYNTNINDFNINLDLINDEIKKQTKISNAYEIINYLPTNNIFRACVLNFSKKDDSSTLNLVIYDKITNFKKIINVEQPNICYLKVHKFYELDIQLFYNSRNFYSNKFPFSIKIL